MPAAGTEQTTKKKHRTGALRLGVLGLAHAVNNAAFIAVLAMAPQIQTALALSATAFGALVSAYLGTQMLFGLPVGGAVDRIGVRRALVLAGLLVAAGAAMMHLTTRFWVAMAAMALMGLAYSFVNPSTSKGVLDWFPSERRATAMGVKQTGVPLGGVIGAGIGALAGTVDWRSLMLASAVLAAAGAAACLSLPGGPKRGAQVSPANILGDLKKVVLDRNLNIFNLGIGIYQAGQFNFFTFIALFMREAMQAGQPLAAACVAIGQVASAVGRLGWGPVSDFLFRGRRKPVLMILGVVGALSLAAMSLIGGRWGIVLGVGLVASIGLTVAGYVALVQTIVVETARPEVAATAVGYNRLFTSAGAMLGPPAFGYLVDSTGYGAAWLMTAAVVLTATILIALWFRERRR